MASKITERFLERYWELPRDIRDLLRFYCRPDPPPVRVCSLGHALCDNDFKGIFKTCVLCGYTAPRLSWTGDYFWYNSSRGAVCRFCLDENAILGPVHDLWS